MKWKEVLTNSQQFPDDFVVRVKNGDKEETLSLGEMRAYDTETKGALTADLTKREKEIEQRESNVSRASVELAKVIEKTAASAGITVDELLEGKTPTKRQVADANDLDENDPLVGKLVKEIRVMKATIESQGKEIERTRKEALGPMLNTYLSDHYKREWKDLAPTLPKGAKVELKEALDYAQKNKFQDESGRWDLSKAIRDLTYEARIQEEAEKRVADLRKKDEDARVLAAAPKPSSLGTRVKADKSLVNDKGQTKNFDEVLNDALADTDLWRGVQNAQ